MAYHEYFPQEFLDLAKEVTNHPELQRLLANHAASELEIKFAEIAAYCDVVLDGVYDETDLRNLARILTTKLHSKRIGIIS